MKLSNNRDIDRVHVRDMDSVGLVTADIENSLPPVLHARLLETRSANNLAATRPYCNLACLAASRSFLYKFLATARCC